MHIVFDLRMVGRPPLNAMARHALELARRLPALAPEMRFDFLVGKRFAPHLLGALPANARLVPTRLSFLSPGEQVELPALLWQLAPDLYHAASPSVPRAWSGALALTVHDTNPLAFPEVSDRLPALYYRHVVRPAAMRAPLLFAVSQFARNEIESRLGLPPGRVRVVHNGLVDSLRPPPPEAVQAYRRRLGLPERFVLYLGGVSPHKNVTQLIDAFRLLSSDLGLVLCTSARSQAHQLRERAGASASRVRLLEPVPEEDLPLLYAAARVFCFPSLYESFGLPPLEAMACGTPVVATRATALPEVLGDAAALVRPGEVLEMAEAIARADADPEWAQALRGAGLARAARFSWDHSAEQIAEAYRSLARGTGLVGVETRQSLALDLRSGAALPDCERLLGIPGPRGHTAKVLFCVRSNLYQVPGGDSVQILRTKASLEALGVDVMLWSEPFPPPRGSLDLAHLWHLSRLDTFVHARSFAAMGLPFVLSTIYWPTDEFARRGNVGALRLLHRALASGPADFAKDGARALLAEAPWRGALARAALVPLEKRMAWLAQNARCLLPNSAAEGDILKRLGARQVAVVVNATDPPPESPVPLPPGLPPRFVLCAGRIEPRKNQLALLQALAGFELPLVLVGSAGPLHRDYFRRVQRAAEEHGATHLPGMPREQLFALYAAAEAHVAPAWYETPGLVSLEAAAAGTRVVTTDRGCTVEYFGSDAFYLDPGEPASMRRALERALQNPRSHALRDRVLRQFTWERAAEQTLAAYRTVLGSPRAGAAPETAREISAS